MLLVKVFTRFKYYKVLPICIALFELIQTVLLLICLKSNQSWFYCSQLVIYYPAFAIDLKASLPESLAISVNNALLSSPRFSRVLAV